MFMLSCASTVRKPRPPVPFQDGMSNTQVFLSIVGDTKGRTRAGTCLSGMQSVTI